MTRSFAALPPFAQTALFVDVDGTLLDIAPTPEQVVVPEGLADALRALRHRLGDALAVVSGRPVEQLEALLGDAPYALAGEHGSALRPRPAAEVERCALPTPLPAWYEAAERIAASHEGVRLERKPHGFVLHYRARPALGERLGEEIGALIAGSEAFLLMPARKAWEVRPRGVDKGTAVRTLMRNPPFAARRPLFIGDDVTDEDGISAAEALGGCGLWVPEVFGGPAQVRQWLARAARDATWPAEVGTSA
ncbi:MAG: trehalose-phosphatase [Alphaproteobacteria bacterium]|nr:trehalose-phosphatase [Alphaproteobacteria bacterium]